MAIKQEIWDEAKALFELDKPLSFIEMETGISKGSISKRSKKETWVKGKAKQLVLDDVRVTIEKETKTKRELELHNAEVSKLSKDEQMIRALTNNNMVGVGTKLKNHTELNMLDHKNAQDLIDKASITLGVNQRHANAVQISNTNAQQVTISKDEYIEARAAVLSEDDC